MRVHFAILLARLYNSNCKQNSHMVSRIATWNLQTIHLLLRRRNRIVSKNIAYPKNILNLVVLNVLNVSLEVLFFPNNIWLHFIYFELFPFWSFLSFFPQEDISVVTFFECEINLGIASHSLVKEELTNLVVSTAAPENIYLTPCASTSSAEIDAPAYSPLVAKRRKEKSTTASHLCEQIDPEKGQVCFLFIFCSNVQKDLKKGIHFLLCFIKLFSVSTASYCKLSLLYSSYTSRSRSTLYTMSTSA